MNFQFLSPQKLSDARNLYPHTKNGSIYLNHASTGPFSTRVVEALTSYLQNRSSGIVETYRTDVRAVTACKNAIQTLVHAESSERIAFISNTSEGINIIASGLPWKSGGRVVLNDSEFPANVYPYYRLKKYGVELDILKSIDGKITPSMIEQVLTPKTRVVALSAVQFLSGYRADLEAIGKICRSRGIWFVVDGIQAAGAIKIDVQKMCIDAFAAGGQKWLMAPHGIGFLYLTESMQNVIDQQHLGWLSVSDPWQFFNYEQPLSPSARRYEGGSLNIPGVIGMHPALETLLEFEPEAIESHILAITKILMNELQTIDGLRLISPEADGERAGIVSVRKQDGDFPLSFSDSLEQRGMTCSVRNGTLRFSPHFYNTPDEMKSAAAIVSELLY
ncbi:MAG TPA: aminotransferase class V-fold PLP-dependent enzyme [Bacteroidota bacterium]|nr:aminotransferase class V-fold PLP-dependent enzyme [Bacteroidota bacterium]